ncbi:hypothetical protein AX15_003289 [Amanita polypyramis BW_CC]|nr:hypothetical protein AX15_003289 [Amanita polypyramis BW_CC]
MAEGERTTKVEDAYAYQCHEDPRSSVLSGSKGTSIDESSLYSAGRDIRSVIVTIHNNSGKKSSPNHPQSASETQFDVKNDMEGGSNPKAVIVFISSIIRILILYMSTFVGRSRSPAKVGQSTGALPHQLTETVEKSTKQGEIFYSASLETSMCKVLPIDCVTSLAERYSRLMLGSGLGYPLYLPEPDGGLPLQYREVGVRVGDVGRITPDGAFDFLFNICLKADHPANPSILPDCFAPIQSVETSVQRLFEPATRMTSDGIRRMDDTPDSYCCKTHEGAILVLPDGAVLCEAQNKLLFWDYAARHAEKLYKYMHLERGRDAPNGSLYIVTGCIKSESWGIATFDRPSQDNDYLQFITVDVPPGNLRRMPACGRRYYWKQANGAIARTGPSSKYLVIGDEVEMLNQCIFLRGYKVTLQEEVWKDLVNPIRMSSAKHSGWQDHIPRFPGSGASQSNSNPGLSHAEQEQNNSPSNSDRDGGGERFTVHDDWHALSSVPTIHPSSYINLILLQSVPDARVALTHDDDWRDIHFGSMAGLLEMVMSSRKPVLDDRGCVSLINKDEQQEYVSSTSCASFLSQDDREEQHVLSCGCASSVRRGEREEEYVLSLGSAEAKSNSSTAGTDAFQNEGSHVPRTPFQVPLQHHTDRPETQSFAMGDKGTHKDYHVRLNNFVVKRRIGGADYEDRWDGSDWRSVVAGKSNI